LLQSSDTFAEYLCPCLALAIVILAGIGLLCSGALLTGRLGAIASLYIESVIARRLIEDMDLPSFVFCKRIVLKMESGRA
jgi:hypothetical protein